MERKKKKREGEPQSMHRFRARVLSSFGGACEPTVLASSDGHCDCASESVGRARQRRDATCRMHSKTTAQPTVLDCCTSCSAARLSISSLRKGALIRKPRTRERNIFHFTQRHGQKPPSGIYSLRIGDQQLVESHSGLRRLEYFIVTTFEHLQPSLARLICSTQISVPSVSTLTELSWGPHLVCACKEAFVDPNRKVKVSSI